jgi:hypothetical protein
MLRNMRARERGVNGLALARRIAVTLCVVLAACGGEDPKKRPDGEGGTGGQGGTGATATETDAGQTGGAPSGGSTGQTGGTGAVSSGGSGGSGALDPGPDDSGAADAGEDASADPCDDGDLCTTDSLRNGVCVHAPIRCTALDQCHNAGVCDPATGQCSNPNKANGTACNDGDGCTQTDTCQAGVCTGGNPKVCEALDACHVPGVCDPATGACSNPNAENDTPCDDNNACTQLDTCQEGVCTGTDPVICGSAGNCYEEGTCDTTTGACDSPPKENGAACDDNDACTQLDLCDGSGNCVGSNPVVCTALNQCHDVGTCDATTGVCSNPPKANGSACNDGSACTQTDTCQEGVCTGDNLVVCPTLDCYNVNACNPATGACVPSSPKAVGAACNDNNACTQTDTCNGAGACLGTNPVDCGDCALPSKCDPATGSCNLPDNYRPAGTACSDGNACTLNDSCDGFGTCTGTAVTCVALNFCHDAGTCDPTTGECSNPTKAAGVSCSDGNNCTTDDVCNGLGVCSGTPVVCSETACREAGTCIAATGVCSAGPAKPAGTPCDDGNVCTQTDACNGSGLCVGSDLITCSADDDCHLPGTCDPMTGVCSKPEKPDGSICNDGNACTQTDTCASGVCLGSNLIVCTAQSQCHNIGTCNPDTGVCSSPQKTNGTSCNDNNACTTGETCQDGTCSGGTATVCDGATQCKEAGTCNPATGVCSYPNKAEDTPCDDANACTQADVCRSGTCTGTDPVVCTAQSQCHNVGTCDTATGACSNPLKSNGTPCDDGTLCTQGDTCQSGTCTPTSTVTCTALSPCHDVGTCDPTTGVCSNPPKSNGAPCDDGDACTQNDTCQDGFCDGADPVVCTAQSQCHNVGTCNPATGVCSNPQKTNGTACDDGNACTQTDTCQSGACNGADLVVCTALSQCHNVGTCDTTTGVCSNPQKIDGSSCNDGLACTTGDVCVGGVCSGTARVCDDGIPCTTNGCIEPTGCVFDTSTCDCISDIDCNDGNPCNGVESCDVGTGTCTSTPPMNCSGLDGPCADGVCDPDLGCVPEAFENGIACSDGNACTLGDTCQGGICTPLSSVVCSPLSQCHDAGTCDPDTGLCSNPTKPPGSPCDDGDPCTQGDACNAGACAAGTPVVCMPLSQCHNAGICDPASGLCSNPAKPAGSSCDDDDECTAGEFCSGGTCGSGTTTVCNTPSDPQCQFDVGTCDPASGDCGYPKVVDGTGCDDSNKCTENDACIDGSCTGGPPNLCVTGTAREQGCGGCIAQICAVDPYCCNNFWDSICVGEVWSVCGDPVCYGDVYCGDGICTQGMEDKNSCPHDCFCGDGVCDYAEGWKWTGNGYTIDCPQDCFGYCGDGICSPELGELVDCKDDCYGCGDGVCDWYKNGEYWNGESSGNCPQDCFCGDGYCEWYYYYYEDGWSCPSDCAVPWDGVCSADKGEHRWLDYSSDDCRCAAGVCDHVDSVYGTCGNCFCGDNVCSPNMGEEPDWCGDCVCGNGTCDVPFEDRLNCPSDCRCGDGRCDNTENSENCEVDCKLAPECAHSRCQVGAALQWGCDSIVNEVCSYDSFCCYYFWDKTCVNMAQWLSQIPCP